MAQKVTAQIVKKKYTPPDRNPYMVAELTLLDSEGQEFVGSPRRLPEFKAAADLLRREAATTHETLQNAFAVYEAGKTAKITLTLQDDQISNLGFRPPE